RDYKTTNAFEGVIPNMHRRYMETDSFQIREDLDQYKTESTCDACNGMRLREEALAVKINTLNVSEVSAFSIEAAHEWFGSLDKKLNKKENEIATRILKEINERLSFLMNVGLEYLTLSRKSGTLSGG